MTTPCSGTASPPLQPFGDGRTPLSGLSLLLLQCRQPHGRRWRTTITIRLRDLVIVQRWLELAMRLDPAVEWRAVDQAGGGPVSWDGVHWR